MYRIVSMMLLLLLSGCATEHAVMKDENMSNRNISKNIYQVIKSGTVPHDETLYTDKKRAYLVFRSDRPEEMEQFHTLYTKLTAEEPPHLEGTVVVAMMGQQRSGGYSFRIDDIRDDTERITLKIGIDRPEGLATMALTNPYVVILLPERYKEVKVVESE